MRHIPKWPVCGAAVAQKGGIDGSEHAWHYEEHGTYMVAYVRCMWRLCGVGECAFASKGGIYLVPSSISNLKVGTE